MRIALLGPPGAGKGTQAAWLSEHYRVPVLATGELLKANVDADTALGRQSAGYLDRGELVPDDLVIAMVRERFGRPDCARGFVLDGFPRTVAQAESLDRILAECDTRLDAVVELRVDTAEVLRRIRGRADIEDRADDDERTARHRLQVFAAETAPLREYYRRRGLLVSVAGTGPREVVSARIAAALEERMRTRTEARP